MRKLSFTLLALLAAGAALLPAPAQAWWRGGVWVGVAPIPFPVPFYAPPPVYYAPPPVFVAPPPPVVFDPSQGQQTAQAGFSCAAGAYVCPLEQPLQPGTPCSCPGNRGRVSGYAR